MKKIVGFFLVFLGIGIVSILAYKQILFSASYNGLPSVPCIDATKPIQKQFSFFLTITIQGKNYPLESTIGHDSGNCLRIIHANDMSGKVIVVSNTPAVYSLQDFFRIWHKTFTKDQLFAYRVENGNSIEVLVNGRETLSYEKTLLLPNESIKIMYH